MKPTQKLVVSMVLACMLTSQVLCMMTIVKKGKGLVKEALIKLTRRHYSKTYPIDSDQNPSSIINLIDFHHNKPIITSHKRYFKKIKYSFEQEDTSDSDQDEFKTSSNKKNRGLLKLGLAGAIGFVVYKNKDRVIPTCHAMDITAAALGISEDTLQIILTVVAANPEVCGPLSAAASIALAADALVKMTHGIQDANQSVHIPKELVAAHVPLDQLKNEFNSVSLMGESGIKHAITIYGQNGLSSEDRQQYDLLRRHVALEKLEQQQYQVDLQNSMVQQGNHRKGYLRHKYSQSDRCDIEQYLGKKRSRGIPLTAADEALELGIQDPNEPDISIEELTKRAQEEALARCQKNGVTMVPVNAPTGQSKQISFGQSHAKLHESSLPKEQAGAIIPTKNGSDNTLEKGLVVGSLLNMLGDVKPGLGMSIVDEVSKHNEELFELIKDLDIQAIIANSKAEKAVQVGTGVTWTFWSVIKDTAYSAGQYVYTAGEYIYYAGEKTVSYAYKAKDYAVSGLTTVAPYVPAATILGLSAWQIWRVQNGKSPDFVEGALELLASYDEKFNADLELYRQSKKKSHINDIIKEKATDTQTSSPSPQDPKKPDEDEKKERKGSNQIHKNGKYNDADYHHQNSSGQKSRAPKDGQKALDNSIQIKDTSPRRVGVSDGEIVIFDQTMPGEFHGHVRTYDEICSMPGGQGDKIISALRDAGLINKKGHPLL